MAETFPVVESVGATYRALQDHGLVSYFLAADAPIVWRYSPDREFGPLPADATAAEIARALCDGIGVDDFGDAFGALFTNQIELRVRHSREYADRHSLPSIATGKCSAAASVPAKVATAPRSEAVLVSAAIQGVAVAPGTTVEDVISFREQNGRLMGRFRASIIDLAEAIQRDAPPAAVSEQAHAILKNRVEPALGDLEEVLKRGRIRYAWKMLTGATSILLGPTRPAFAAMSSGRIASQALDYAFDRDKLIREHPYGLLHAIRAEFGESASYRPLTLLGDPLLELEAHYVETLRELVGAEPSFAESLERTRSRAMRRTILSPEEERERLRIGAMRRWPEVDGHHIEKLRAHSYVKAATAVLERALAQRPND